MKDIHEVLRRKQAKFAQLGKQIEMLQQAAGQRQDRRSGATEGQVFSHLKMTSHGFVV